MVSSILPLTFHHRDILFHSITMCRRRQVRNVYIRCGHAFSLPEEYVRPSISMRAAAFILACFAVFHSRFDASSPTAGLAFSILRAANLRLVCGPVGSTAGFLNSTPPISILIVPSAAGPRQTKLTTQEVLA
ncbi:uncharacterized protein ARMOST_02251 [Armillaria ostoyae]|uniref:Uncharacterized protein n=1 Tax=Armillaria ostoyae TaxID=47428 RepID=A0A284QR76_ARMOS|nr:uncharacterized protein ARMOST_02251 [Armillaria ostoyae]